MKQEELNEILRLHEMWLNNEEGGKRADFWHADLRGSVLRGSNLCGSDLRGSDLRGSDLRGSLLSLADIRNSNLRGADLRGANWDFSVFPLWCGGSNFTVDTKFIKQLLAHVCTLKCDDDEWLKLREAILPFAKKSHRAEDLGLLDKEEL